MRNRLLLPMMVLLIAGCDFSSNEPPPPLPPPALPEGITTSSAQMPRFALVIGNANYKGDQLNNPVHDATDMRRALSALGYQVTLHTNLNLTEMDAAVESFSQSLPEGSMALFFYAGHGVQVEGENYLVPVDAEMKEEKHAERQALKLSAVVSAMSQSGSEFNLLIMDACRNNPFYRQWKVTRGNSQQGLAKVAPPEGTVVAFSTSPGNFSDDGSGRNSPYTASLLQHIQVPNVEVGQMLRRVRRDVREATNEQQSPWSEFSFSGEFFFSLDSTKIARKEDSSHTDQPKIGQLPAESPTRSQPNQALKNSGDATPLSPKSIPARLPLLPNIQSERVNFPGGADRILLANGVMPGKVRRYVVNAREGQIITARITDAQGPVGFDVLMPGGEMMADASGVVFWESYLPVGGDYSLDVSAEQEAQFTIEIAVSAQIPTE